MQNNLFPELPADRLHLRAIYKEAWEKKEHYGFVNEKYIPDQEQ